MAGFVVVRRLEVSVDIAVAGRKNAAMLGRVKPDNRRLDARQLEYGSGFSYAPSCYGADRRSG